LEKAKQLGIKPKKAPEIGAFDGDF